ncbi:MAG: hypothetical protein WBO23_19495 [Burkholderiales bacterium]
MSRAGMPTGAALRAFAIVPILCAAVGAHAGEADVIAARASRGPDGKWSFAVTIRSNDKGWKYYCDRFEVRAPDGRLLGVRRLLHPHEDEQPFTRELDGVGIPPGLPGVLIRAHHNARGYDGDVLKLQLPR